MKKIFFGIALTMLLASCGGNPSVAPSEQPSESPSVVPSVTPSEPVSVFVEPENAYKVTFTIDENIEKILIYPAHDYEMEPLECEQPLVTYSRNDETGEYAKYFEGVLDPDTEVYEGEIKPQVNFKVVCKDGYEPVIPTFEGDAKNVKNQTESIFRITVIKGDITVHCTSQVAGTEEDVTGAFEVKFNCTNCHVIVWKTENVGEDPAAIIDENDKHYARNKTSGAIATDGSGQIYFKVVADSDFAFLLPICLSEGEAVAADVDFITGTYNKAKYDSTTGVFNLTKIAGELVVTLSAVPV